MDPIEIGKYIRKTRKSLGLKIDDLADENISSSTISKIERVEGPITDEKKIYLCRKLNLNYYEIPTLIMKEKEQHKSIMTKMKYIEQIIDLGEPKIGLKKLRSLDVKQSTQAIQSFEKYLRGRCQVQLKKFEKAKGYFQKALQLIDQSDYQTNIQAACFNQLGIIAFFQNDFKTALDYTDQGIKSFSKDGELKHLKYSLASNKAVYLEKLNYIDRASNILYDLWQQKNEIEYTDILLNMYDVQARIFKKNKMYSKGIENAKKGIELAKLNRKTNRLIELLSTLGSIYLDEKKLEEAEDALTTALALKNQVKEQHLFLVINTRLGRLYLEQNKPKKTQELLEEAISCYNTHDVVRHTQALITLGDALFKQEKVDEAEKQYKKALDLSVEHSLLHQELNCWFSLGKCYKNTDRENYLLSLEKIFEIELILKQGGV